MGRRTTSYMSLGSNMGDTYGNLAGARKALQDATGVELVTVSPLYHTRPVGKTDQAWFLNQVVEVKTTLAALALLQACQRIESDLGRVRHERWGPRTLDIDILVFGDVQSDDPELTLPHPRLLERAFVLVPLADIAPELVIGDATVQGHLERLAPEERSGVKPYPIE